MIKKYKVSLTLLLLFFAVTVFITMVLWLTPDALTL